ncbi:uncharacterized protein LOC136090716 [Hydra vulgaris]|uniref:Uncharacterized protein LOC136090716 n=1 Tax=Hydra vulgaris TaxID=6087 RepID=A0ABM4DGR0_HYDVU
MNNSELLWLTHQMGHTKDVHQNWYRLEDSTIELTKVAKVLLAMDNGDAKCIENKKIDLILHNGFKGNDEDVVDNGNSNVIENELINVEYKRRIKNKRLNMHEESEKTWKDWAEEENASLRKAFSIYITRKISCPLLDVKKLIESIPCLQK